MSYLMVFLYPILLFLATEAFVNKQKIFIPRENVVARHLTSKSMEELREQLNFPHKSVIDAVAKSNSPRLTIADAASLSGCDLKEARTSLMSLASFTGADLEVTEDGNIVYIFPKDFKSKLQQRSVVARFKKIYNAVFPYLFYAVRVSFGVALLSSLAIIATTFVAVNSSSSDDDRNSRTSSSRGYRGGSGIQINSFFGPDPFDFLYWDMRYSYYRRRDFDPLSRTASRMRTPDGNVEMSFMESFFSYIFGDGDPNEYLTVERTRLIAAVIRSKKGFVVAEDLAPYLDPPELQSTLSKTVAANSELNTYGKTVDESWVLPAVTRLGGIPEVTDDGDIVYTFPDLGTTVLEDKTNDISAKETQNRMEISQTITGTLFGQQNKNQDQDRNRNRKKLSPILQEERIPFSLASSNQRFLAGILGAANFGGALWLTQLLAQTIVNPSPTWFLLKNLQPWLLGYAILYNAVPLFRSQRLQKINADIDERNKRREQWLNYINSPDTSLTRKINAAHVLAARAKELGEGADSKRIKESDIAYSTVNEQDIKENELLVRFDRNLKWKTTQNDTSKPVEQME
jgi:hypothetical protein